MSDPAIPLPCPDCAEPCDALDNYCRNCGRFLRESRPVANPPAVVEPRAPAHRPVSALEPRRPALPAPVRRAATAVAIGTALKLTLNVAGKLLARRTAARSLARRPEQPRPPTVIRESLLVRHTWIERD